MWARVVQSTTKRSYPASGKRTAAKCYGNAANLSASCTPIAPISFAIPTLRKSNARQAARQSSRGVGAKDIAKTNLATPQIQKTLENVEVIIQAVSTAHSAAVEECTAERSLLDAARIVQSYTDRGLLLGIILYAVDGIIRVTRSGQALTISLEALRTVVVAAVSACCKWATATRVRLCAEVLSCKLSAHATFREWDHMPDDFQNALRTVAQESVLGSELLQQWMGKMRIASPKRGAEKGDAAWTQGGWVDGVRSDGVFLKAVNDGGLHGEAVLRVWLHGDLVSVDRRGNRIARHRPCTRVEVVLGLEFSQDCLVLRLNTMSAECVKLTYSESVGMDHAAHRVTIARDFLVVDEVSEPLDSHDNSLNWLGHPMALPSRSQGTPK